MHDDRDHVISVVLSHSEWQEFVRLHPQPSAWLLERIHEMLGAAKAAATSQASAPIQVA